MDVTSPESLGDYVRQRRLLQNMSQQELADKVGASRQWVVAFEAGTDKAGIGLVLAALWAVGTRVSVEPLHPEHDDDSLLDIFESLT